MKELAGDNLAMDQQGGGGGGVEWMEGNTPSCFIFVWKLVVWGGVIV